MKKLILFTVALIAVTGLYSQPSFIGYALGTHTITILADNTTQIYQYNNNDFDVILHKANNKYTNVPMDYTDGEEMIGSAAVLPRSFTSKLGDQATYDIMLGYFDKYITEMDGIDTRRNINHPEPLFLTLAVSSSTGKVEEVKFKFSAYDGFEQVSPLAYYYIEKAIKENVSFNINSLGKRLNYLPITYSIFLPAK